MNADKNLDLIRARYDAVNSHDWKLFESFYDESIIWSDPGLREPIKGPGEVRKRMEKLATAFPDLNWKLERLVGQDEYVYAEFTFTGTHGGELPDNRGGKPIPPSNETIQLRAIGAYTVQGGKITESRIYFNFGELYPIRS